MYKNSKIRGEIDSLVLMIMSRTHMFEDHGTVKFTFDNTDDVDEKINGDLLFLSKIIYHIISNNFKEPQRLLRSELEKLGLKKNKDQSQ
jgi:hypothetical protein